MCAQCSSGKTVDVDGCHACCTGTLFSPLHARIQLSRAYRCSAPQLAEEKMHSCRHAFTSRVQSQGLHLTAKPFSLGHACMFWVWSISTQQISITLIKRVATNLQIGGPAQPQFQQVHLSLHRFFCSIDLSMDSKRCVLLIARMSLQMQVPMGGRV